MYGKLSAAAFVIAVAAVAAHAWIPAGGNEVRAGGAGIVLVPAELDGAPMRKHWRNPQRGTIVEVGAQYAASHFGPSPVMLDFFRGDPHTHNGIGCFLGQGESLDSENLRTLATADGKAVFDVGILRTPGQVRLIAATECTPERCLAQKLPLPGHFWHQWDPENLSLQSTASVVPVAIILTHKTDGYSAEGITDALKDELRHVAGVLDLRQARRLAAVQAGRGGAEGATSGDATNASANTSSSKNAGD